MVANRPAPAAPARVVFFGTPQFAVPTLARLAASRHPIAGVITQPDRRRGRGQKVQDAPVKAFAMERGLTVFQPDRLGAPGIEETLRAWQPEIGVVAAYGQIIPESLLAVPRLGMINVHASLLPRYRGAAPVHRAIIAGERETGVTIMRVIKQLDAGGMLARARRSIGPDETSDIVERDLSVLGAELLLDVLEQLVSGTAHEEPQDDRLATYASRLTKEEGLIDWTLSAPAVHNKVRGLYPWPHAYTFLGGERLIVLATRVEPAVALAPPGTITELSRGAIQVSTGDGGAVVILEVQPEGRRPMPVRDFLAGHPLPPGSRFAIR